MKLPLTAAILFFCLAILPLQAARPRIACIGDSITQSNSVHKSYRYNLWKKLIDNGVAFDFVGSLSTNFEGSPVWPNYLGKTFDPQHEGHWGWRADEVLSNLPTYLASYTPDIVLIHLGSNDLIQGQTISSTIAELTSIISTLRSANPKVIVLLAQVIPYSIHANSGNISQLNTEIALLAQTQNTANSNVVVVDQFTGFSVDQDTFDKVHPNGSGEEKMATRWATALLPYLNVPPVLIASGTLTGADQLRPYSTTLAATQGYPPYQWALGLGATLPNGLSISQSGELTGTPLVAGDFSFSVVVTDSYQRTNSKTVTVRVASALEVWRDENFQTRVNAGDAADHFDYDHDGLVNLVEFAFGLDPKNPSSRDVPMMQTDGPSLSFAFTQPANVGGIIYGAEWSTSLDGEWTAIISTASAPQYFFSVPMEPEPMRFMRLRVRPAF